MKTLLTLSAVVALVIAFANAYADDDMTGAAYDNDRMITNDNLPTINPDQGGATLNRMPAESNAEGSAAGGMGSDSDNWKKEGELGKEPVDKTPMEPGKKEPGTGGYDRGIYRPLY